VAPTPRKRLIAVRSLWPCNRLVGEGHGRSSNDGHRMEGIRWFE
jgi:hypothetical protein